MDKIESVGQFTNYLCDCAKSEQVARKKLRVDGVAVYGYECQNCGRFEQKAKKSFGWQLPTELTDESIRDQFRERRHAFYKKMADKQRQAWDETKERERLAWRESYETYLESDAWQEKRKAVLERDNHTCQGCLKNRATHVHHLSYKNMGNEPLWELVSICIQCHRGLHPHMQEVNINWEQFK